MTDLADKKLVSASEVVPMMSKITEDKLTSPNYLDWSKTICLYLRSIRMSSHLDKDPPTDDSVFYRNSQAGIVLLVVLLMILSLPGMI